MKTHILLATAAAFVLTPALAQQAQQSDEIQQIQQGDTQSDLSAGANSAEDFVAKAGMGDLFEIETAQIAAERAQSDEVRQFAQQLLDEHRQSAQDLASAAQDADVTVAVLGRLQMETTSTDLSQGASSTTGGAGTDMESSDSAAASGSTAGSAQPDNDSDLGASGSTITGSTGAGADDPSGAASPSGAGTGMAASDTHVDQSKTAMLDPEHQAMMEDLRNATGEEFDRRFLEIQIQVHEDAIDTFEQYSENGEEEALRQHAEQALPALREHLERAQSLQDDLG